MSSKHAFSCHRLPPRTFLSAAGFPSRHPIQGGDRVARFVAYLARKWAEAGKVRIAPVSGGVGLLFSVDAHLRAVMTVEISDDGHSIDNVFVVVNPDKLAPAAPEIIDDLFR